MFSSLWVDIQDISRLTRANCTGTNTLPQISLYPTSVPLPPETFETARFQWGAVRSILRVLLSSKHSVPLPRSSGHSGA